jgi:mRNA deadenylase 3'-5' endonuclease subunit Ccr4
MNRTWKHCLDPREDEDVRICSYNILADGYDHPTSFPYCPLEYLKWEYRWTLIKEEIDAINPDVLCLQEVSGNSYKEVILPRFESKNYKGYYVAQTKTEVDVGVALFVNLSKFDVIQHKPLRIIDLAADTSVFGNQPIQSNWSELERKVYKNLLDALKKMHHVGQAVIITRKQATNSSSSQHFLVGNFHAYYNPKYPELKVMQVTLIVNAMKKLYKSFIRSLQERDPRENFANMVLCGDLNTMPYALEWEVAKTAGPKVEIQLASSSTLSTPQSVALTEQAETPTSTPTPFELPPSPLALASNPDAPQQVRSSISSGVYSLLTQGSLATTHVHHPYTWRKRLLQPLGPLHASAFADFHIGLSFLSSYKEALETGEVEWTNWHGSDFKHTLDYIFLGKQVLAKDELDANDFFLSPVDVVGVLLPPTDEEMQGANGGMNGNNGGPSSNCGSDHIAIASIIRFRNSA